MTRKSEKSVELDRWLDGMPDEFDAKPLRMAWTLRTDRGDVPRQTLIRWRREGRVEYEEGIVAWKIRKL